MKRILLSAVAVATLASTATADTNSDIEAMKAKMAEMATKIETLETTQAKKATPVFAKTSKLKFSGTHYLGFVHGDKKDHLTGDSSSYDDFETRRNY